MRLATLHIVHPAPPSESDLASAAPRAHADIRELRCCAVQVRALSECELFVLSFESLESALFKARP